MTTLAIILASALAIRHLFIWGSASALAEERAHAEDLRAFRQACRR